MPNFEAVNELLSLVHSAFAKFPQHANYSAAVISITAQKLFVYLNNEFVKEYPISSSRYGVGQVDGSYKTPIGIHCVQEKIGEHAKCGEIFVNREPSNQIAKIENENSSTNEDCITSRILWLKGLEEGINKGPGVDSYERYIYIHGTHEEGLIGQPASIGCIRMKNQDVIDLYDILSVFSLVIIHA